MEDIKISTSKKKFGWGGPRVNAGGARPNSGRKPGFIGYWKGKKRPDMVGNKFTPKKYGEDNIFFKHNFVGEKHANWKGDKVGYEALHDWVNRKLGKPEICEFCGKDGLKGRMIHWANKSGKYLRKLSDWLRLCAKCHYHYD